MAHTAPGRHTGWKSLGEPDEVFSCATAQLLTKTDLCMEVRMMLLLTAGSENVFFLSRLDQSFAKAVVKHGISCRCALNRAL